MFDDDNAKEIEAALREDADLDYDIDEGDSLTLEEREAIRAEALAEEEFIADREDTVNPLIFDKATKQTEDLEHEEVINLEARYGHVNGGVIGSGNLEVAVAENPISNEHELRKENVNENNDPMNPIDAGAAPMDDMANPVNDAPVADSGMSSNDTAGAPVVADTTPTEGVAMVDEAPVDTATSEAMTTSEVTTSETPAASEAVADEAPVDTAMSEAMDAEMAAADAAKTSSLMGAGPEPAPSADVPAATETPTPIPGGMPTTPVDANAPTAESTDATADAPKKKKKTGLIVGIIVAVLLAGGVVGGILFYNAHEAPEKQVSDAVMNALSEQFVASTSGSSADELGGLKMSFSGSIKSPESDSDETIDIKLSADVALKDTETLYVKIDGVKEAIDGLMDGVDDAGDDESAKLANEIVDSVVKEVDDKWIAITSDDVEDDSGFDCLSKASEKLSSESYSKKVKGIYEKYPFVHYKKDSKIETIDGLNYYEVEIDEEKNEKFDEEFQKTDEYKEFSTCMEKFLGGMLSTDSATVELDADDLSDDDLDDAEDDVESGTSEMTMVAKLGITTWTHELKGVKMDMTDKEDGTIAIDLRSNSYKDSDVSNAASIDDVVKNIENAYKNTTSEYMKTYAKQTCEEYEDNLSELGYESLSACEEGLLKEMESQTDDDFDITSLLYALSGAQTDVTVEDVDEDSDEDADVDVDETEVTTLGGDEEE